MAENFKISGLNLNEIKKSDISKFDQKTQELLTYLFDHQDTIPGGSNDDTLSAKELETLLAQMDKANADGKSDGEISDAEVEKWVKDNLGDQYASAGKGFLDSIKNLFSGDKTEGGKLKDIPGLKEDGEGAYVEVQKWGSDPLDGNAKANSCLWNIAKNYYPDMDVNEAMDLIMAANPQIYDDPSRGTTSGSKTIYDGERINLPNMHEGGTAANGANSANSANDAAPSAKGFSASTSAAQGGAAPKPPEGTNWQFFADPGITDWDAYILDHSNDIRMRELGREVRSDGTVIHKYDRNGHPWFEVTSDDGVVFRGPYDPSL